MRWLEGLVTNPLHDGPPQFAIMVGQAGRTLVLNFRQVFWNDPRDESSILKEAQVVVTRPSIQAREKGR